MSALLLLALLAAPGPASAASAEDAALERLRAPDAAARERACVELASATGRGTSVYAALALAMDRDLSERVRLAAAKAVIAFPGDDPLRRAQAFLQSEPGAQNRIDLTVALSTEPTRLEDSGVTDLLSTMLSDDPSPEERRAAALGLARHGDARALPALRRAQEKETDASARDAASQAVRTLSAPRPARPRPAPPKARLPKPGAVKGEDDCPEPRAWCECGGPIRRSPKCLARDECRIEVDTAIHLGMSCTWSGLPFNAPN